MLLLGIIIGPFAITAWEKITRWWRTRNLRLCDYDDLHEDYVGLISPSVDGVIDYKHMHQVERRAWQLEVFGERKLIVPCLSSRLEEDINKRYYQKGMKNAYERASRTLLRYERQRNYYGFDEEFDELYRKAKEMQPHSCLRCKDSGTVWGPYDSGCHTEVDCECQKKSIKMF